MTIIIVSYPMLLLTVTKLGRHKRRRVQQNDNVTLGKRSMDIRNRIQVELYSAVFLVTYEQIFVLRKQHLGIVFFLSFFNCMVGSYIWSLSPILDAQTPLAREAMTTFISILVTSQN